MTRARLLIGLSLAVVMAVLAVVGFTPIHSTSHDKIFAIPKGTWARRMSGDKVEILPDHIRLTLGVRDILVLRNQDDVPQVFGPTLMMPGQSFRLPFERAAEYTFACTAHASGQMTIVVEPNPTTPWARIRWRLQELSSNFR
jgi:plastocyanin